MEKAFKTLLFCSLGILLLQSCTKNDSNVIKAIDTELLFNSCIPDFSLILERDWNWTLDTLTEYILERTVDSVSIHLRIGLYSDREEANDWLAFYVSDASASMNEGHPEGLAIGDQFYWWSGSPDAEISNIMFFRYNAFFMMNCRNYNKLDTFALNIDQEILRRAPYISFME